MHYVAHLPIFSCKFAAFDVKQSHSYVKDFYCERKKQESFRRVSSRDRLTMLDRLSSINLKFKCNLNEFFYRIKIRPGESSR